MPAPAPARRVSRPAERWRAVVQASVEHDTPLGRLGLAASGTGLCAVLFPEPSPGPVPQSPFPQSPFPQSPTPSRDASRWVAQAQRELDRYFTGRLREFTVPLDLQGTPFQLAVWQGLRQIPLGTPSVMAPSPRQSDAPGPVGLSDRPITSIPFPLSFPVIVSSEPMAH